MGIRSPNLKGIAYNLAFLFARQDHVKVSLLSLFQLFGESCHVCHFDFLNVRKETNSDFSQLSYLFSCSPGLILSSCYYNLVMSASKEILT